MGWNLLLHWNFGFQVSEVFPYTKFYHHLMFAFTKEKGYEKRTETG